MNIIQYLQYYIASWRHPSRKDFISGGFGIAERFKRCKRYWEPHLKLSRAFISKGLYDLNASSIAVLGAGRLLDVPLDAISTHAKGITLVDADPGVLPFWRRAGRKVNTLLTFEICDVSGRIDVWTDSLSSLNPSCTAESAAAFLTSLSEARGPAPAPLGTFEVVISVNLLSQIPLFWEDRVRAAFPHLAQGPEAQMPDQLEKALARTKNLLIEEHLAALGAMSTNRIILITDSLFHYYTKDKAHWRTEEALGFPRQLEVAGFAMTAQDSWLWHLAPQGVEREEYGEIHKVSALLLERPPIRLEP